MLQLIKLSCTCLLLQNVSGAGKDAKIKCEKIVE